MSNYRKYENPLILREQIIELRDHTAYLLKSGAKLDYILSELETLADLEYREYDAWKDEMNNGTL